MDDMHGGSTEARASAEVLAALTHKLGSPLGTILNYTHLLTAGAGPRLEPDQRAWIERIAAAAGAARDLLDQARAYLDGARQDARLEDVDLASWIRDDLGARDGASELEIRDEGLPRHLLARADPRALRRVAASLRALWNALGPPDGRPLLTVAGASGDGKVAVTFRLVRRGLLPTVERWDRSFEVVPERDPPAALGVHHALLRVAAAQQGGDLVARLDDGVPTWTLHLRAAAQG